MDENKICNNCDFYDFENSFCSALCKDCHSEECACYLFYSQLIIEV